VNLLLFDNPMLLGMIVLVGILTIAMLLIKRLKPIREVMYLRERDRRGQRLRITEETATTIYCRRKTGNDKRFFKWGGSYIFHEGGRMVTRFFGKEGTAYTYRFQTTPERSSVNSGQELRDIPVQCTECGAEFEWPVPVSVDKIVGEKLGSLRDALIAVWGEDFYNMIPEEQRKIIDDGKIYVTVELEGGLTPPGYRPISEDDINEEQDRSAARIFARALGPTPKQELYKGMLWAALGALLTMIAWNLGIFG